MVASLTSYALVKSEFFTTIQSIKLVLMKAFVEDNWHVPKMMEYVFDRIENSVGKGENAGYSFPTIFSEGFSHRVV